MRPGATFGDRLQLLPPPDPLPFFDGDLVPSLPSFRLLPLGDRGDEDWAAIVDERDHERLVREGPWFVIDSGYAVRTRRKADPPGPHLVYLHREVTRWAYGEPPEGHISDHRNGCTLDCRRVNLRWATLQQNRANFYGLAWRTELLWAA